MPSHSAFLIECTPLAWPSTKAEMQAKLGGATFKQTQSQTDTLYFSPKSAELPLTTTFLDGIGVTHTVTLTTKEDEVHVLVPLPSKTFTRHINTYQSIEWQFNSSSGDGKGRTSITPGPTLAECIFTYSEKGTSQSWHPRQNRSVFARNIIQTRRSGESFLGRRHSQGSCAISTPVHCGNETFCSRRLICEGA